MPVKLELPRHIVHQLLEEWRNRVTQLEGELGELSTLITSAEAQLKGQYPLAQNQSSPQEQPIAPAQQQHKRPKGENLRIITEYMKRLSGTGATVAAIHKGTGIGISSVRVVLDRHRDTFVRGENDGLWRLSK